MSEGDPMAQKFDPEIVRQVLDRIDAERLQELAAPGKPLLLDCLAKWGTKGLQGGVTFGFLIALFIFLFSLDSGIEARKTLVVSALLIGTLAIPGALAGLGIGFLTWAVRRRC